MKKKSDYWVKGLTKSFLIQEYSKNNNSTFRIAKILECASSTVYRKLLKYNIPIKSKKELRKGYKSSNNKGGKTQSQGYQFIWKPYYYSNPSMNYVRVHRLKMENKLGRKLKSTELIHHVDLNKLNNRLSNLYISSKSKHIKMHHQLQKIAGDFIKMGIIKFKNGRYYIARKYK